MEKKILVIDDDVIVCTTIRIMLAAQGYQVVVAHDGRSGYQMAEREKPDLLLVDILMPRVSGSDFCEQIRQNEALRHIPIIMMSAVYRDLATRSQICKLADGFLEKPFREAELLIKIRKFLFPAADKTTPETLLPETAQRRSREKSAEKKGRSKLDEKIQKELDNLYTLVGKSKTGRK